MYIPITIVEAWPTPNYVNPVVRGPSVIIINVVLYALVLIVVSLRIYTRIQISRSFGKDDAFILIAMVPTTVFVVLTIIAEYRYGWDRHAWDLLPSMVSPGLKISLATQILYATAGASTRLSMLFLTRRILSKAVPQLSKVINITIGFTASAVVIFIIVVIFQCRPISAWWTLSFVPQNCIDERRHLLAQGILSIIADFLAVLLPLPVVLTLHLPFKQRIIVAFLFGAGFVVCIAGIFRTYFYHKLTLTYHDVTWDAFPVWLSTAIELYVGILCTSAPPTKPVFARYLPRLIFSASQHKPSISLKRTATSESSKNILITRPDRAGSKSLREVMVVNEYPLE